MTNRIIKFILIALSGGWMIYQFAQVHIGTGILFLFITAIIVGLLFRHELVLLSFIHLRRGKTKSANSTLNHIKHPEQLPKRQEAYYYFLRGLIMSQANQVTKSEKMFRKSLNLGLRMKQDRAVAKLNLAGLAVMKRKKREAINLISEVKKLDSRKMLDDQIKMIQSQMKRI